MLLKSIKKGLFWLILMISTLSYAQTGLPELLETAHSTPENQVFINKKFSQFLAPLRALDKENLSSLRTIFRKTQKTFLHTYRAYSGIDDLFSTGYYDCLTATSLFSLVLDELGYSYSIMETNYHVFLLVRTTRGEVLVESTDRFDGLITDADAIAERVETYRNQAPTASQDQLQTYYQYNCQLYKPIHREELIGLIYYNKAVVAYNNNNWNQSRDFIAKARQRYASPRCLELEALLEAQITVSIQSTTEQSLGRSSGIQHQR
jgi:hypothetical protein